MVVKSITCYLFWVATTLAYLTESFTIRKMFSLSLISVTVKDTLSEPETNNYIRKIINNSYYMT